MSYIINLQTKDVFVVERIVVGKFEDEYKNLRYFLQFYLSYCVQYQYHYP